MQLLLITLIIFIVGIVLLLSKFLFKERPTYEYLKSECIMTPNEKIHFYALLGATNGSHFVFPQIHYDALLIHKTNGARKHMNQKSADFVLCNKETLAPELVIELYDRYHNRPDRKNRDYEVARILSDVHLPLLITEFSDSNDIAVLSKKIREKLDEQKFIKMEPEKPYIHRTKIYISLIITIISFILTFFIFLYLLSIK
jgi:hypothetical protein